MFGLALHITPSTVFATRRHTLEAWSGVAHTQLTLAIAFLLRMSFLLHMLCDTADAVVQSLSVWSGMALQEL